ncbi:MAG: hypothetical protein WCA59_18210, partial [Candidatus Binataceae bacterium]
RWYVVAIFANRVLVGPRPLATPVLAILANNPSVVCGSNASGEGVDGSQELDLAGNSCDGSIHPYAKSQK